MSEINLNGRLVGPKHFPLVIAEIGINHGGSLDVAFKMVDAAARAGVEVIKHQTHVIGDEMSSLAKKMIPGNCSESIYEVMEKCTLSESEEFALKAYVESKGIIFLSTPFSREAVNRLERMGVCGFKIGSGECSNYPLIKYIAKLGKPVILSTGMNDISSIRKAVAILEQNNINYALLHTTNLYPTPPNLVRLGAMVQLRENFPNAVVGLSDHTTNNIACMGAIALGANIVERHFTDSMDRLGPDIVCSMDEANCRTLIEESKILYQELGGLKAPLEEERVTINFAFASVVTIKSIKKGEIFTEENLWVKRPGLGGIPAEQFEHIIGRVASRDLEQDVHLKPHDIS